MMTYIFKKFYKKLEQAESHQNGLCRYIVKVPFYWHSGLLDSSKISVVGT
jgi:hypothetical protein